MSDGQTDEIPQAYPERYNWFIERARRLEVIRGETWIRDELAYLWDNPDEFAAGNTHECPENVEEEDYNLFRLALLFGVEYEQRYPTGEDWGGDDYATKPKGMVYFRYTGPEGFEAWGAGFPSGFIVLEWIPQSVPDDEETIEHGHQSVYHSWDDFRAVCTGEVNMIEVYKTDERPE